MKIVETKFTPKDNGEMEVIREEIKQIVNDKVLLISGYQGVGKTTFTNEPTELLRCLDIESSEYRDRGDKWYVGYVIDIIKAANSGDYDVIFLSSHQTVRDLLNRYVREGNFYFILPDPEVNHVWTKNLALRVQDSDYDPKNIRALMSHILYYDNIIEELESLSVPKRNNEKVIYITNPAFFKDVINHLYNGDILKLGNQKDE